jgi:hypothetical protein
LFGNHGDKAVSRTVDLLLNTAAMKERKHNLMINNLGGIANMTRRLGPGKHKNQFLGGETRIVEPHPITFAAASYPVELLFDI